jgi:hypothetical protein
MLKAVQEIQGEREERLVSVYELFNFQALKPQTFSTQV